MEDDRIEVFDDDRTFNASMVVVSIVICILLVLGAFMAWCCGSWICGLIGG